MKLFWSHIGAAFLAAVITFIVMQQGCSDCPEIKPTHTIVTKTDTFRTPQVYVKVPIYIKSPVAEVPIFGFENNSACDSNRVYSDSLVNNDITIVYQDSVNGKLLDKKLTYKLRSPLEIKTVITITDSVPYPVEMPGDGLYLSGGGGTDLKRVTNLSLGINYLSKNDYGGGYFYNFMDQSHNLQVFYKIRNPFKRK